MISLKLGTKTNQYSILNIQYRIRKNRFKEVSNTAFDSIFYRSWLEIIRQILETIYAIER